MRKAVKRKNSGRKELPINGMQSKADRFGSYTGTPSDKNGDDMPVQDVDDL